MPTTNITINKTSYTEIAGIGTIGRLANLNDDSIYIISSATQPSDTDVGFLCVGINETNNNIIPLGGNSVDKIWARLADNSLSSSGSVVVVSGEMGVGGSGSSVTICDAEYLEGNYDAFFAGTANAIQVMFELRSGTVQTSVVISESLDGVNYFPIGTALTDSALITIDPISNAWFRIAITGDQATITAMVA
jgi:hypothetical protein